jgi:signal transduction histidine kinase
VHGKADAAPAIEKQRRVLSRAVNPLVRAVGRIRARVRTKLLAAFVGTVVLLVVVGVLGLRVLGGSNHRVERLGTLQLRATAYRELQTEAAQLRLLLALRAAGTPDQSVYVGGTASSALPSTSLVIIDKAIASTLSQVGPATDAAHLGFVPPPDDQAILGKIRADYGQFSQVMVQINDLDQAGHPKAGLQLQSHEAGPLVTDLQLLTAGLVTTTQGQTSALIAQNLTSFANSQHLFIAVAAGSVFLALLLGFVLSLSLIVPIQRMETRLAAIASGDFSGHVDVPNRDELGALGANVNRMNDELGRLYKELETVSRHKSEFLANMSHELRTPLNAIIGFSEVLREQMFGELNEAQMDYINDVLESGQHLLSLINDILDLSKVEAGRMELELGEVFISQALESGMTMHGERASRNGVTLGLAIDPDIGVIRADERKVRQVIFNLLSNAVKFTPSGGRVDVQARLMDGMVEVAVADTGGGIAPEDQERVFEEFQQAPGSQSGKHEGTGLGLTLSRKFIELHGGHLWVESELGAGSTFRFTLPVARPG